MKAVIHYKRRPKDRALCGQEDFSYKSDHGWMPDWVTPGYEVNCQQCLALGRRDNSRPQLSLC